MSYSGLTNTNSVEADYVNTGDVSAYGLIDFSQGTLTGFPVDNTSIIINSSGQLSSIGGIFQEEYVNYIYPSSGNTVSVASLSGQVLITNKFKDNSLTANQVVVTDSSGYLSTINGTSINDPNTIVKRDSSGNISAGLITANLDGNATTSTTSINFSNPLSGDVIGTQTNTSISFVGGKTSSAIASCVNTVNAATSSGTASTIVMRDSSGSFCGILNGTVTGSLSGDVTGSMTSTVVSYVNGKSASSVSSCVDTVNLATSSNSGSTIVKRDGSGNFSAGTITADLIGNSTTATNLVPTSVNNVYVTNSSGTAKWTPVLDPELGGTGFLNSYKIGVTGLSAINQDVRDIATPSFTDLKLLKSTLTQGTILKSNNNTASTFNEIYFPETALDNVVLNNYQCTLTNKNFDNASCYFSDNLDSTKKVKFDTSGITSGQTRVITVPDTSFTLLTPPVSIVDGGTNSTSALTNGKLMYSVSGKIIENSSFIVDSSSNLTIASKATIGTNPSAPTGTAILNVNSTTQNSARIVLSGQEFYAAGNTSNDGPCLICNVNRTSNRQLCIGDSAKLTQNSSNPMIRFLPNSTLIDAIATDGTTPLGLTIGNSSGSLTMNGSSLSMTGNWSISSNYSPTVNDGVNNFTGTSYGYYTTIGNMVYVVIEANWTGKGSASAVNTLGVSLPFAVKSFGINPYVSFTMGYAQGINASGIYGRAICTGSRITFSKSTGSGNYSNVLVSDCNTTGTLNICGWYPK